MSEQKYLDILSKLTLDEKLSLLSGKTYWLTQEIDRLGVPSVWMSDGPHGMRKEKQTGGTNIMQASETSTCFPTAVTTASSWDTDLLEEVGATIADEAKALKVTTVLGPGVNIKRSPLCGRNFEYISEDPFLTSVLGKAFIKGGEYHSEGDFTREEIFKGDTLREVGIWVLLVHEGNIKTNGATANFIGAVRSCFHNSGTATSYHRVSIFR